MTTESIFSLEGRVLKFNTVADVQPHVDEMDKMSDLTEIRLSGNTFGVEAGCAIATALKKHANLRVTLFHIHF
jgi:Ran GTPase-activating protein 1